MKVLIKSGALAAILAMPFAANAATIHNVTAPVDERGIPDGGVYGTVLEPGDTASVDVVTARDGVTASTLGFDYAPSNARQEFALTLNGIESGLYGSINAYLSADDTMSDDDIMATKRTLTNEGDRTIQNLFAEAAFTTGRFFVLLDWTTEANNSFSYDVNIAPAPVPVPAAGLLLLGGLGGFAALRRRKKAA